MNWQRTSWLTLGLLICGLFLIALGICTGSNGFENLFRSDPVEREMIKQIVWEIRLPRTLGAWAAGALLGLAGAIAQGLFRNPLADPYLLGSASGATLGVAAALAAVGRTAEMPSDTMMNGAAIGIFSGGLWFRLGLTGAAFAGAALAVLLTLTLARGTGHTLRILLAGVVVGVVLGAMSSLILLFSPDSLQVMQTFMLGSTVFVGWNSWALLFIIWLICIIFACLLARALDGLSLGEATALSLGIPLNALRTSLIAVLALATGTAVAQTGLVAFVGLAAPHLVRAAVKVTHRRLMWLASLTGGTLLSAADLLARWLIAPQELPIGVLTATLGGGYLLWLMHRRASSVNAGGNF